MRKEVFENMLKITILILLLTAYNSAIACSCRLGPVEKKLSDSESVFLGRVSTVIVLDEKNGVNEDRIIVKFDVNESFKKAESLVTLDTFDNKASCEGYWFKEGEEYLIYAYRMKERLSTYYCGGVIPKNIKDNSDFLSELNTLKKLKK
jgi:hypothetical protein